MTPRHQAISLLRALPLALLLASLACATPLPPELDLSFEEARTRADADERRAPDYKPVARDKLRPKLFRGALDCRVGGLDFGLVLAVDGDGTIAASYVEPSTLATRCLARRAERAQLPPPPSAPFFVGATSADTDTRN